MLFRIVSDTHLEYYIESSPDDVAWDEFVAPPRDRDSEAVLVLAGDICEFQFINRFETMWRKLAQRFKSVLYVPGNHEYYGYCGTPYSKGTFFHHKELLRSYGKIHLLDNATMNFSELAVFGATLWTNYNKENPITVNACRDWSRDFNHSRTLDPVDGIRATNIEDYIARYNQTVEQLKVVCGGPNPPSVVVTHFAPSTLSIHEKYSAEDYRDVNHHFVNNLEEFILDRPHIKLWIHGHTHTQFDYMIGETRVICNPKGFQGENTYKISDLDYIEV